MKLLPDGSTSSTWRYFVNPLSELTNVSRAPLGPYQLTTNERCPPTRPSSVAAALPVIPCGVQ